MLATERDVVRLLGEYLEMEIRARKQADDQARQDEESKADNEHFLSVVEPAAFFVGALLALALLVAGLLRTDLVGLFAPGHTSSEAVLRYASLTGDVPAFVGKLVSLDDLKAALLALLGLVVARAAFSKAIATVIAVILANLLLAASFILIGAVSARQWPGFLVFAIVAIGTLVFYATILPLVDLRLRGILVRASPTGFTRETPPTTWQRFRRCVTSVRCLVSTLIGLLLISGLASITYADAHDVFWSELGFGLGILAGLLLIPRIVFWGIDGAITRPTLDPNATRAITWTPVVATSAVVVISIALNNHPDPIRFVTTPASAVGILCLVAFLAWFVWAEIALRLWARMLYLTIFAWVLAAVFFYGSDPLAFLGMAVLAWSVPRSLPWPQAPAHWARASAG